MCLLATYFLDGASRLGLETPAHPRAWARLGSGGPSLLGTALDPLPGVLGSSLAKRHSRTLGFTFCFSDLGSSDLMITVEKSWQDVLFRMFLVSNAAVIFVPKASSGQDHSHHTVRELRQRKAFQFVLVSLLTVPSFWVPEGSV